MVQICQKFVNFVKFSSHDFFFQQNDAIVVQRGLNPLTLMGDQHRISPYNINTISSRQVMRNKKNINDGIISWSNTKFSKLTSQELYGRQ